MKWIALLAACGLFLVAEQSVFAGKNEWTTEGPFGGTFNHIVFDPRGNKIVLAGASVGVFRSLNNGKTWSRTNALFGPILIHSKEPDRVLAGGGPIFLSTNKGKTWQLFAEPSALDSGPLSDMVFHPQDPTILYGITQFRGVFKSTDRGLTWFTKNNGLDFQLNPNLRSRARIKIDSQNGKTLYVTPANGTVSRSTNGGESWEKVTKGLPLNRTNSALTIDPNNPKVAYIAFSSSSPLIGLVFKTTNGGNNWFDTTCNCEAADIQIDPRNSKKIYVAGCNGMFQSTDGGKTWPKLTSLDNGCHYITSIHPKNSNILLVGRDSFGIQRSTNGGKIWNFVTQGLDSFNSARTEIHPKGNGQIYADDNSHLFRSNQDGKAFQPVLGDFNVHAFDIHPDDPDIIALGTGGVAFGITKDGGKTMTETLFAEGCPIATCVAFHPQRPENIYLIPASRRASLANNFILGAAKSTDMGETWKLINTGLSDKKISVMSVASQNGDVVYLGTGRGKIFRTTNAGRNWKNSSIGLSGSPILSIAIHPKKINTVFATDSSGNIFKSINGSKSWTVAHREQFFSFNHIAVDPREATTVYAGAFPYGIYISLNEGEDWSPFNTTGLGIFAVRTIDFPPGQSDRDRATLTIGTEHGVFSFTASQKNGEPINERVPAIRDIEPDAQLADEVITILGKNFGTVEGQVDFENARGITPEAWSDTTITVRVPAQAAIGDVTVVTASDESNGFPFTPLPATGKFTPTEGPKAGGYEIAINDSDGFALSGSNFFVLFGEKVVTNCTPVESVLKCPVPPSNEAGTVTISLDNGILRQEIGTFTYR